MATLSYDIHTQLKAAFEHADKMVDGMYNFHLFLLIFSVNLVHTNARMRFWVGDLACNYRQRDLVYWT
jgi:hypothetical protein